MGKENQLFRDFVKAQSEINGITPVDKFIKAFKLGAKIGMGLLNDQVKKVQKEVVLELFDCNLYDKD